jgi:2'-5' RNA ligase
VHLTLKFLGSTRPDRVAQIVSGLRSATVGTSSFELRPEGFGAFHGGKKAATSRTWRESYAHNVRVIFVGVEGATDELGALVSRIDEALEPLGIEKESRPYFAHLTLARVREDADRATREGISSALSRFQRHLTRDGTLDPPQVACSFPTFTVPGVSLMESTLQPGGAVYRALETIPLRG